MASEFVQAFRKLVGLARDNPTGLAERARSDPLLQNACDDVSRAHLKLWMSERYSSELYSHTVPQFEIVERREFERRWRAEVAATDQILGDLVLDGGEANPAEPSDPEQARIEDAAEIGRHVAGQFESLIDYARDRVDSDDVGDFSEWASPALWVWDDLNIRTGFRLQSIAARLELVPFILIPSEVSRTHGSAETISLFQRLREAQRAFIFGCDLACAALQRSILEDVLPSGKNLPSRIAVAPLPWGLTASDLRAISDLARDVLHPDRDSMAPKIGKLELVKHLIAGLHTLQKLIEFVPDGRPAK